MIVDELVAILGYDLRGEAQLRRFRAGLESARGTLRGIGIAAAAAAGAVTASLGLMGRNIIGVNAEFEGFAAQLETIEGSATAAQASLDWISDFARKTPYEVAGLTDAFVKLKAYGIDPIANDALETLGNAASAMNKPLEQAVEAFADASSFQFERLREFGIVASQAGNEVTFQYTKNGKTLQETVAKDGEAVRRFLLENFGDRFNGAMERQSRTFSGLTSNLSDAWTDFRRRIGEAGYFDAIKGHLQDLLGWIERMDASGALDRWATAISDVLTAGANNVRALVERMTRHFETLQRLFDENPALETAAKALGLALVAAFAFAFPVTALVAVVALALEDLLTYLSGGESVIGDIIEWFRTLGQTLTADIDAETFRNLGRNIAHWIFEAVKMNFKAMWMGASWIWATIKAAFSGGDAEFEGIGADIAKAIFSSLKAAWATYEGIVLGLIDEVVNWFTGVDWAQVGRDIANGILNGLKEIGGAIKDWFASLLPDGINFKAPPSGSLGGSGVGGSDNSGGYKSAVDGASSSMDASPSWYGRGGSDHTMNQTNNNNVTVNVTEMQQAAGAAAQATGAAVGNAVSEAARVQAEGAR